MDKYILNTHEIITFSSSELSKKLSSFVHAERDKIVSVNMFPVTVSNITLREDNYPHEQIEVEVNVHRAIILYKQAIY